MAHFPPLLQPVQQYTHNAHFLTVMARTGRWESWRQIVTHQSNSSQLRWECSIFLSITHFTNLPLPPSRHWKRLLILPFSHNLVVNINATSLTAQAMKTTTNLKPVGTLANNINITNCNVNKRQKESNYFVWVRFMIFLSTVKNEALV